MRTMFKIKAVCSICSREIVGNETVYVRMRYHEKRGITEIKAYLQNEGKFICENCFTSGNNKARVESMKNGLEHC